MSVINLEKKGMYLVLQSTARSLCLFDILSVGRFFLFFLLYLPRHHSLQSSGFIRSNLTLFVLYASVVLVHQSCYSFIVLDKENILLWSCFTRIRWSMTMWNDCLHTRGSVSCASFFFFKYESGVSKRTMYSSVFQISLGDYCTSRGEKKTCSNFYVQLNVAKMILSEDPLK